MFTMPEWLDGGAHAGRPAATAVAIGALYSCTDHALIYQSDGATWSTWASLAGTGSVATDSIWDAKGDLAGGTGANTAARLPVAANGSSLRAASGAATGLEWQLNNLAAAAAPTVNEDSGDGYSVGSRWIDTTNDKEYVCLDATVGAAVWTETTGGGSTAPTHAFFTYAAASLEPLAIEQLYKGAATLRTAGASETLLVVSAWSCDLGAGRWEIRDPLHPLMPIRNIAVVGNEAGSLLVLIAPALATYTDAWTTYYDRLNTIYTTKPLYLAISAEATGAPFLAGPYGSIITSVNTFDLSWLAVSPAGTTGGWPVHSEIGDANTDYIRVARPTLIPVSKLVASALVTGTARSGSAPEASITYINCPSTWGKVTDATSYAFRDDFMGASLDTTTGWTRTQSTAGNIEIQTAGGTANWLKVRGDGTWGNNGAFSQTSIARATGKIFQCDIFLTSTIAYPMIGFHDGAGTSYTDFSHGLQFTSSGPAVLKVWENGNDRGSVGSYAINTIYRVRITLGASNNATYEIQGGAFAALGGATWTDITPGTSSSATTPLHAGVAGKDAVDSYVGDVKLY